MPAKNAEYYEAVRLLAAARFNLGSPCECVEIIRKPPDSIAQLTLAYENCMDAGIKLHEHIKRYHKTDPLKLK